MKDFNIKYKEAVKLTAKENKENVKDYANHVGINTHANLYPALKNGYANGLKKAIDPFIFFGAKVEIKITCSTGKEIILK